MKGVQTARQLYDKYGKGELDKDSVVKALISLIEGRETSEDSEGRIESLKVLCELDSREVGVMKLIQGLILSDSDEGMRRLAAEMVIKRFLSQSHSEVRWALENEPSIDNVLVIIGTLKRVDENLLGQFLRDLFNYIISKRAPVKHGILRQYYLILRDLFEKRDIRKFSIDELVEIYLNYRILLDLEDKYSLDANYCHHILTDGLIGNLDLSGLKIKSISEIPHLEKLTNLGSLDLSGNEIQEISSLECFHDLGHLNLSFNRITEIKNLDTLISLEGLELEGNLISEIKGLDKLVKLEFLTLGENQIKKIEGLDKLKILHELTLNDNQISVIEKLNKLKNLHFVSLFNNPIRKIKRLKKLKKMKFKNEILDLLDNC